MWVLISGCIIEDNMITATFKIDGMIHRDNILWLGWPADIGIALDGLDGIEKHSFDSSKILFTILFNSKKVSKEAIINAVENAGSFTVRNWTKTTRSSSQTK